MRAPFRVTVSKDYLTFSSAHFITLSGHKCESLHGHNYQVTVTVEGSLDPECAFVVDFAVLKRVLRPYVDAMDHKVILPTGNAKLTLRDDGDQTIVDYLGAARFVFPTSNVCKIAIANTTAESLAEFLAHNVWDQLGREGISNVTAVEVDVEESPGQSGVFRLARDLGN
ncbi:MAG: 6-carboxytetrahydropterin synthase [Gemmatimonadota bacterium]